VVGFPRVPRIPRFSPLPEKSSQPASKLDDCSAEVAPVFSFSALFVSLRLLRSDALFIWLSFETVARKIIRVNTLH